MLQIPSIFLSNERRYLWRFLVWGSFNTLVGLAAILLLQVLTGKAYLSNALGFAITGLMGYKIHSTRTFQAKQSVKGLKLYFMVLAFGYVLNVACLRLFMGFLTPFAAQLAAVFIYVSFSFVMNRKYVFKSTSNCR